MENKSHTKLEEAKKYLKKTPFHHNENVGITLKSDHYEAFIHDKKSHVEAKNAIALADKLLYRNQLKSKNTHVLKNSTQTTRSFYVKLQKKIIKDLASISKDDESLTDFHSFLSRVNYEKVFQTLQSIQLLPDKILAIDDFKHFECCQIMAHEKGNTFVQSYTNGKNEKNINVDSFNKCFQMIKKSKQPYFSSSLLPQNISESTGHFLASTFSEQRFNWIILLSRNDLFPPTSNEIEQFSSDIYNLSPIISSLLNKYKHDENITNSAEVLDLLDLPISIQDEQNRNIYTNNQYDNIKDLYPGQYKPFTLALKDSLTLTIFMKENSESPADLYHYHKITLLGELLNTLGHELSNPLFGLNLSAELLKSSSEDEDTTNFLKQIVSSSKRCQQIIKNFSQLYDRTDSHKKVDLIELIRETIILTKSETRGVQKDIVNRLPEDQVLISTNPTWLSQIIFNLVMNAAQAILSSETRDKGLITISCGVEHGHYKIIIEDNGPGIPNTLMDSITNNYFTTKKTGNGLGLSICVNLLKKLGGHLSYSNKNDGPGAVFSIDLPLQ